jgi:L-alanine-DL-glutamate epimerase-like enolase superfamily enzyme
MVSRYGFRWLKLKAGHDSRRDTRMIAAVREAVGPDIHLTVDCNHGYQAYLAEKVLPLWRDFDLEWIEEPCPGTDIVGRARAAKVSPAPFMIDESAQTPAAVMEEIRRGVCRVVSIKVARTGVALSRKILTLCESGGLRPVVGGQGDTEIGALAAAQFGAASRLIATNCAELSFFLDLPESISVERPIIEDGRLILPDTPGIGAQISDDRLQRYRIDH